ncbi:MAG: 50S ribosomal protein L3 [Patescibacteria group bacterium UBA2163]
MNKFIVGIKKGMSQVFDAEGNVHPVTVIAAAPITVTQVKNTETDGYNAVQVGIGERKEKNVAQAQRPKGLFATFKEFRFDKAPEFTTGNTIDVSVFEVGDTVTVSATSKGKGFQGVVKRHGFHGGPRTHGQKHTERAPGSIGAAGVARVLKGTRMAGRMGGDRITVQNLPVVQVDAEKGEILVGGAVPGRRGAYVEIVSK